ncbi:hypothetical protein [Flammeovirga kamogawensis]|uniref:Uncharacterized protein n=1 Tax=Flammeovirga kamogawensis TaxID=373891 RepID=A0ABX8H0G5_9BACT|nr:hypothetical protein [Flammeovirga kamogawensis]MBB6462226.1 hypothetical protein [Flammeovirga kamogawensis]QWG09373.1 hypothetical protein KM029_22465 [Flammeovirga kamogawensis]TRX64892.1 hypothetical protein EO216_20375 [Flammeovirga kamogawensis]
MNSAIIVIFLLLINAALHLIAFFILKANNAPHTKGVVTFAIVNSFLAIGMINGYVVVPYLIILLESLGFWLLYTRLKRTFCPKYLSLLLLLLEVLIIIGALIDILQA